MRNDIAVSWGDQSWGLATDEGPFHGGDDTAPPPLALFAAGFTGCLMTQIRAFSKRLDVPIDGLTVPARLHWAGRQEGRGPYVTRPVGFSLDVDMGDAASDDDKVRLFEAAKKGCFLEQTFAVPNAIGHRLKTSAGWVDC